jgi:Xaa-Pro aminopeptidase
MIDVARIQAELAALDLDGWLLYDFRGQNPFARDAAGFGPERFLTRRWFCLVPREGAPRWIVHAIEEAQFRDVPGERLAYARRETLLERLREALLAAGPRRRVAMEYSPLANVPTIAKVVASGDLVQALLARWPPRGRALHDEAARAVERAGFDAFAWIEAEHAAGRVPTEVHVQRRIVADLEAAGLAVADPPIVAVNAHAADPHYATGAAPGNDAPIDAPAVVLLDIWAKKRGDPEAIYADVTFMGHLGATLPASVAEVFGAVARARDTALAAAQAAWVAGTPARGFEVDRAARDVIERAGYGPYFTHRTGHSLGIEDHWIGANIDDFETREERRLIAGTGFTIEPGVYLPGSFGVRLEIDVFVGDAGPEATTLVQRELRRMRSR